MRSLKERLFKCLEGKALTIEQISEKLNNKYTIHNVINSEIRKKTILFHPNKTYTLKGYRPKKRKRTRQEYMEDLQRRNRELEVEIRKLSGLAK